MLIYEFINSNYCAIELLEKYKIDYFCNGDKSLEQSLSEKAISLVKFLNELEVYEKSKKCSNPDFSNYNLIELYEHIINHHHQFIRIKVPEIKNIISSVSSKGEPPSQLISELNKEFDKLSKELISHLLKEERVVFPIIKHLVFSQKFNERPKWRGYGTIKKSIDGMFADHINSCSHLERINMIKNSLPFNYKNEDMINMLFEKLSILERDLHMHIHLENNMLFPKSIELEESLLKN